jgi:hypothetical protein
MTAAKWCQLPIWSFGTDKAKIIENTNFIEIQIVYE